MSAIGTVSNSGYAQQMRRPRPILPRHSAVKSPSAKLPKRRLRKEEYPNRIAELAQLRGLTYADIADAVDAHEITIAKLATGRQELTLTWMKRLAPVLGATPAEIIAKRSGDNLRAVIVKGELRAGAWAEKHQWQEDDQYEVMIPDDPAFRGLTLYGGAIEGESMNRRYPSGAVVILSRLTHRPGEIEEGRRYHVQRVRADGQTEETIKMLARSTDGRYWLVPESTDPEHQEWIPLEGKAGETIHLVGRVRYVVHRED